MTATIFIYTKQIFGPLILFFPFLFFKDISKAFFFLRVEKYVNTFSRTEIIKWFESEKCFFHSQFTIFAKNTFFFLERLSLYQIHKNSFSQNKNTDINYQHSFSGKKFFLLTISNTVLNLISFKAQVFKIYEQDSNIILFSIYISKM